MRIARSPSCPLFAWGLLVGLLFLALGCHDRSTVRPVTGKVTLDSKPLADASISFQPVVGSIKDDAAEGMGSYGRTNAEGEFVLFLVDTDQPGALIGTHAVRVSVVQRGMGDDQISTADNRLPSSIRDGSTRYTVQAEGENRAIFDLKFR